VIPRAGISDSDARPLIFAQESSEKIQVDRDDFMRICHLGKYYPPACGGIETHLQTLAQAQAKLGASVRVVCVNHANRAGDDVTWRAFARTRNTVEQDGDVEITRLSRWGSVARLDICPTLPVLLKRLQSSCDLLHLHVPNPTMMLALAAVRPQAPWVITYHSDVVKQKLLSKLARPFENLVFRRAGAVLVSSPTYPEGSEYLQQQRAKLAVIPFGIDLAPLLDPSAAALTAAAQFRLRHGDPLWLMVGRLVYYKGIDQALRALPHVPGKLLIVGEGPLRRELSELAGRLGVADRVIWQGRLNSAELIGAYHAATALWFPSNARSEAFGFVQVEAMACGCPVINTAIPGSGVAWVSRHEETGLTVPINDPTRLAGAARRLLDDRALRARLGRQGRRRAEAEFGAESMARRTLDVYTQVLRDSAPQRQAPAHLEKV
jgi:glycosyltransferase involved in cell wall biosynthesis